MLVGCAIGCGVVWLAVVVFVIWGVWWVVSPGSRVSTEVVIFPDAVAVVHFADDEPSDPGIDESDATPPRAEAPDGQPPRSPVP